MKKFDNSFLTDKIQLIAGIDEAGRGPLAGPVVAAAVIFDRRSIIRNINDSKKLSESKREILYERIVRRCVAYATGIVDEKEIDAINILKATLKAMKIAADKLHPKPHLILIDGNKTFPHKIQTKAIVKGDCKSFSIASASIIAKVTRDRIMREKSSEYPNYLWYKNKGYGTREHINAVKKYGATRLHRKSFLGNILSPEQLNMMFEDKNFE